MSCIAVQHLPLDLGKIDLLIQLTKPWEETEMIYFADLPGGISKSNFRKSDKKWKKDEIPEKFVDLLAAPFKKNDLWHRREEGESCQQRLQKKK